MDQVDPLAVPLDLTAGHVPASRCRCAARSAASRAEYRSSAVLLSTAARPGLTLTFRPALTTRPTGPSGTPIDFNSLHLAGADLSGLDLTAARFARCSAEATARLLALIGAGARPRPRMTKIKHYPIFPDAAARVSQRVGG